MAKKTNPIGFDKSLESPGTKTIMQTLVVRPARIETADISTWSNAINSFKNGSRAAYYNLCENLLSDGVLADAIDKLVEEVTGAEIAFQIDSKTVDVINDLMDTPEFEELMKEIALSKVYGRSVIECGFAPAFSVYSYPRKNCIIRNMDKPLSERIKFIAAKEGDTNGYDYSKDEFIFEVGKDDDLGLIFRAAQYVIYKRGNFGDWAQFSEIFGMPFLLGKYNSTDPNARDQLFEALSQIGGKPVAAVPKESEVEVVQNTTSGSSNLYKALKDACNEEILIAIQGETMTTLSGSSLSQSKVHQETNTKKGKALKRYVQRMLNKHLVPLLIKRGYPVAGGKFVFPKTTTDITIDELSTLCDIIDIPAEFVHNKYGVPMAKEGEKLAKKAAPPAPIINPPIADPNKPADPNAPTPPEPSPKPSPKETKKPDVKLSDEDRSWFERVFNFFAVARTTRSRAKNLNLADNSTSYTAGINIDQLFNTALNNIYKQYGVDPKDMPLVSKSLFDISNSSYQQAIDSEFGKMGVEFGKAYQPFIDEFKTNASVFAAFKSHAQGNEIAAQLLDSDGNLKSYDNFRKSVLGTSINSDYNENWLKTEYNQAVRSARMAAKVKSFLETADLYPNMEYMETTAATPREEHANWVGTILPINDPWWDTHLPPSAWGCECSVRNTDAEIVEPPDEDTLTINPLFANNPAKTAEIVNMAEHPYVKNCDDNIKKEIVVIAKEWMQNQEANIDKLIEKKFKSGGLLQIPENFNQSPVEINKNIKAYTLLAKEYGDKYKLLNIVNEHGVKNPDALNIETGKLSDAKIPVTLIAKNAIQNSVKEAAKQKVSEVYIFLNQDYEMYDIWVGLKAALQNGRAKSIETIIIKLNNGELKRYDAEKLRSVFNKNQKE
jgi:hypothetical protein